MKFLRKQHIKLFLLFFLVITNSSFTSLVVPFHSTFPAKENQRAEIIRKNPSTLDRASLEKTLGRKMTWRERLMVKVLDHKAHKLEAKNGRRSQEGKEGKMNGMALAAAISTGVMALGLIFAYVLPEAAGILLLLGMLGAIVFGIVALSEFKKNPDQKGKGWAVGSLVAGATMALLTLITLIVALASWGW